MVSIILIEGERLSEDSLRSVSLANAKQLVLGNAYGFGVILHINATTSKDLTNALGEFAKIPGVTGVIMLAQRSEA